MLLAILKKEQFDSWEFRISKNPSFIRCNNVSLLSNNILKIMKVWRKIILSDKAHFHLDGFVNRQNFRVWGTHVWLAKNKYTHNVFG